MDERLDEIAMGIFMHMAAQHAVRHGLHESRGQAPSLARESFMFAEAFVRERDARSAEHSGRDADASAIASTAVPTNLG